MKKSYLQKFKSTQNHPSIICQQDMCLSNACIFHMQKPGTAVTSSSLVASKVMHNLISLYLSKKIKIPNFLTDKHLSMT